MVDVRTFSRVKQY